MPKYKLAPTNADDCVAFLHARYADVHPDAHIGMNRALGIVPTSGDLQEWVERMLEVVATAPAAEVPGLIEVLEAVLSADERPAGELVDECRSRGSHGH